MKKINLFVLVLFSCILLNAQSVADFENLTLGADTFWNGSDLSGGFSSGSAHFVNNYDTAFFSWSGFSYSNKYDVNTTGFGNQYTAITGTGYNGSGNYVVGDDYGNAKVILTANAANHPVTGVYVTNATFAYLSMKNGDNFAKKFGGATGTDPDWFKLTAHGWSGGNTTANSVDFYLADFRSSDSTQDYIVNTWQWMDLTSLGNVDSLWFQLSSSDTGQFGMNTPAYFVLDNFVTYDANDVAPVANDDQFTLTYLQDSALNVTANDVDVTDGPLAISIIYGPTIAGATATVTPDNKLWYSPAIGLVVADTLVYQVCDMQRKCDTALVAINITGITGIEDLASESVKVFPNPFTDKLVIKHSSDVKELQVYDITGKLVYAVKPASGFQSTVVNTSDFALGTYIAKVVGESSSSVVKVIKQ